MIFACICKPSCPDSERKKFAVGLANSMRGRISESLTLTLSKDDCADIYYEHVGKDFYGGLEKHMTQPKTTIYTIECGGVDWGDVTSFKTYYRKKHGLKKDSPDNWVHCPDSDSANDAILKIYNKY